MAGEPNVTLIGNLAGDPEIKFLPSGTAVCNFTVASTPRVKKGDNWEDGEAMWVRCAVWRQQAENVAETLSKGTRVIVTGRLKVRSYEKDGVKRTSIEMDVDGVGPELRYATAKVAKVQRTGGDTSGGSDDAWSTNPPLSSDDQPPF